MPALLDSSDDSELTPATKRSGGSMDEHIHITRMGSPPPEEEEEEQEEEEEPMSPSATPAMRNEGGCHQVQRLPRKTKSKMVCDKDGV